MVWPRYEVIVRPYFRQERTIHLEGTEKGVCANTTTRVKSKLFAIQVVNDWKKLFDEVVEVWSVRKFKGRLDNAWAAVFGEDSE